MNDMQHHISENTLRRQHTHKYIIIRHTDIQNQQIHKIMTHLCIDNKHMLYNTEHGHHKVNVMRRGETMFVLKQTHFSVNDNLQ
jgi:hypothetical protein